jgi:hypothetical protein
MTALPPAPMPSDARVRFAVLWLIAIAVAAAVSLATPILNDGDTFWHVAAGRWMIAHGAVPATDPFSFTFAGRPWMTHEWLSEVLLAGARQAAGWAGVMLLTGLAAGALAWLLARLLLRWLSPISTGLMLALAFACIGPGLLARPHFLALPVLAFWTVALLKAREEARAPGLWLALVMALWANLHSSFIIGLLLAGAFAAEAGFDTRAWRRRHLLGWAGFLAASVVAALATPHGIDGLTFPLKVLNMKTLPTITEWQGPNFLAPSVRDLVLEGVLLGGLFIAFWKGVRLTAVRAAILLGLVHMCLQHVRQEVLLGAVAPLILAEPLGRALGRDAAALWPTRLPVVESALAAGLAALVIVGRLMTPEARIDGPTAPITALASVPASMRATPVLNAYDFGGYLIFRGVRPFIDGRADMYGDAFVAADDALQRGDAAQIDHALKTWPIRWAILQPGLPLVGALEARGWRETHRDKFAVVLTAP